MRAVLPAVLAFSLLAAPPSIDTGLKAPFTFVAYGDARFTDPSDHEDANPQARQALVQAIAEERPAFVSFGGDLVYKGSRAEDWAEYDKETAIWRERGIPVYPILGNHEFYGTEGAGPDLFFRHFPALAQSRYYAVRAEGMAMLCLDSSQDETSGPQGDWLKAQLDGLGPEVDFVFVVVHHPPFSTAWSPLHPTQGHPVRRAEARLAEFLEARQARTRARFVVLASHVHNYERHEHGGVTYFVTGGGGAHAYPIHRDPGDPFQDSRVNYHYLRIQVAKGTATITMRRLGLEGGSPAWTSPDTVTIRAPR